MSARSGYDADATGSPRRLHAKPEKAPGYLSLHSGTLPEIGHLFDVLLQLSSAATPDGQRYPFRFGIAENEDDCLHRHRHGRFFGHTHGSSALRRFKAIGTFLRTRFPAVGSHSQRLPEIPRLLPDVLQRHPLFEQRTRQHHQRNRSVCFFVMVSVRKPALRFPLCMLLSPQVLLHAALQVSSRQTARLSAHCGYRAPVPVPYRDCLSQSAAVPSV